MIRNDLLEPGYVPSQRTWRLVGQVIKHLSGLKECWIRLEALQTSEAERAASRMQIRRLDELISKWKGGDEE